MIRLTNVRVEGFRLLANITIALDECMMAVVGRNNSGKTSFTEVFDLLWEDRMSTLRQEYPKSDMDVC